MSGAANAGLSKAPYRPALETDYLESPNDSRIQGFDMSGIKDQLLRDIAQQGANAQAQAMASNVAMMGGTGSRTSDFNRRALDIVGQTQAQKNRALTDLALQEWKDKQSMMDAYNRAKELRNKYRMGQYEDAMNAYNAEEAAKAQNTAAAASIIGSIFGA